MENVRYAIERIREICSKLTGDKKRLVDALLHTAAKKTLGDTIANEYFNIIDENKHTPRQPESYSQLHVILEAVRLIPDRLVPNISNQPQLGIVPYLSEALASIVDNDSSALQAFSDLSKQMSANALEARVAYSEAYAMWVEKTAQYLEECTSTVRALSYNEFPDLWDKPSAVTYLATHYFLRTKRHCDLRRIFIYDNSYWDNPEMLRRLAQELLVQHRVGINARVCSKQQLEEKGRGFYYPLMSFGTYDRSALAVLIPHETKPLVKFIHDHHQIKHAIDVLDSVYDAAQPAPIWIRKHRNALDSKEERSVNQKVDAVLKTARTITLY